MQRRRSLVPARFVPLQFNVETGGVRVGDFDFLGAIASQKESEIVREARQML